MQYLTILFSVIFFSSAIYADNQFKLLEFDKSCLSGIIKYDGNIVDKIKWQDAKGINMVVLTQTGPYPTTVKSNWGEDSRDAKLYAYGFRENKNDWQQSWIVEDEGLDCPFDFYVGFVEGSLAVTDLDNDNIAEVSFLYNIACRSDVSASKLIFIMNESGNQYSIKGTTLVAVSNAETTGGNKTVDLAYENGPKEFLDYSLKQWKSYVDKDDFKQFDY